MDYTVKQYTRQILAVIEDGVGVQSKIEEIVTAAQAQEANAAAVRQMLRMSEAIGCADPQPWMDAAGNRHASHDGHAGLIGSDPAARIWEPRHFDRLPSAETEKQLLTKILGLLDPMSTRMARQLVNQPGAGAATVQIFRGRMRELLSLVEKIRPGTLVHYLELRTADDKTGKGQA